MKQIVRTVLPLLVLCFIAFSCKEKDETTTPQNTESAYKGNWSGTFTGGDNGTWDIVVDKEGKFSGSFFSTNVQANFAVDSGMVSTTGTFTASINVNGTLLDFDGQAVSSDSANGTWGNPSSGLTGTWSGSKK